MLTRRQLLRQSVVLGAVGSVAPTFLWQARVAHDTGAGALASAPSDRTLIIIQMAGGNDGLNMVVPYADAAYLSARPTLHVDPAIAVSPTPIGNGDPIPFVAIANDARRDLRIYNAGFSGWGSATPACD